MSRVDQDTDIGIALANPPAEFSTNGSRASLNDVPGNGRLHHGPSDINETDHLISFALQRNLIPSPSHGKPLVTGESLRALAVHGASSFEPVSPQPFAVEPITPFDPDLDAPQREAVARALQTPDVLLVQGQSGTGKSRAIAEIIRQAGSQGKRILLLASQTAAVDVVLERLMPAGLTAVRLASNDEKPDLSPVAHLVASAQEKKQVEFWRTAAKKYEQQANAILANLLSAQDGLRQLAEVARRRADLANRRQSLLDQRSAVASHVERLTQSTLKSDLSDPFLSGWVFVGRSQTDRLDSLAAKLAELRKLREELDQRLRAARRERDELRLLEEAKNAFRFWTSEFWRARRTLALPEKVAAAESTIANLELKMSGLGQHELALADERQAAETANDAARSRLIDAEVARRQAAIDGEIATLTALDIQETEAFRTLQTRLHLDAVVPEQLDSVLNALAEKHYHAEREADFAHRWREFVERDGRCLADGWRQSIQLIAGPIALLARVAAERFDLLIVDEAHRVAESDLLEASKLARRWILVGEPAWPQPASPRYAGRSSVARPSRTTPALFQHLWDRWHRDPWKREGKRLCYCVQPVAEGDRRFVESEAVADRPEIELRILNNHGGACLAEVLFPDHMDVAAATEYLIAEWGELPQRANHTGRTCRFERDYRHTPWLVAWLQAATGSPLAAPFDCRSPEALHFEPAPRRQPNGPRRGGAGLEINLADPHQRDLLPNNLAANLPARGLVNLAEAQTVAEVVKRIPAGRSVVVTAPYAAQVTVLRHYCPAHVRIVEPAELAQRECEWLLISMTRSHLSRAVTYGDDPETMNNLLTRARCHLTLVGDAGTLHRRVEWEGAIDDWDEVAGERERQWVNALLPLLPERSVAKTRLVTS